MGYEWLLRILVSCGDGFAGPKGQLGGMVGGDKEGFLIVGWSGEVGGGKGG